MKRLAILDLPADPSAALILSQLRAAAEVANVELLIFDFDDAKDFDAQLERVVSANVQAFWAIGSAYFIARSDPLYQFEVRTKLPKVGGRPAGTPFYGVLDY